MYLVLVTLAINVGTHAAQGVESLKLHFSSFPTHADMASAISQEDPDGRFEELYKHLEVDDIEEVRSEFEELNGALVLNCCIPENVPDLIGHVIIEQVTVYDSSAVDVS